MKITIPGDPIPMARHKVCRQKGRIVSYDPQSEMKRRTRAIIASKTVITKTEQAVTQGILCYMPIPESYSTRRRNACLWGIEVPDSKPDVDNLAKYNLDCCNGVVYEDDKQVVDLSVKKLYSLKPRVEMMIEKLPIPDKAASDILCMISPQQVQKLGEAVHELLDILSRHDVNSLDQAQRMSNQSLTTTASILSQISETYSPIFVKIKKKHPGYYKKFMLEDTDNAA